MELCKPYVPLRLGLLVYDFLRLLFMLELLISVVPLGADTEAVWFPYLVYMAPNALFPLIGFFLVVRPEEYKAYLHLYPAGKIIVIVSILGWLVFSLPGIFGSTLSFRNLITRLLFVLCLCILDAASILGSSILRRKLYREPPAEAPPEPEQAVEGLPEERGLT